DHGSASPRRGCLTATFVRGSPSRNRAGKVCFPIGGFAGSPPHPLASRGRGSSSRDRDKIKPPFRRSVSFEETERRPGNPILAGLREQHPLPVLRLARFRMPLESVSIDNRKCLSSLAVDPTGSPEIGLDMSYRTGTIPQIRSIEFQ